jgi:hypothetical protein
MTLEPGTNERRAPVQGDDHGWFASLHESNPHRRKWVEEHGRQPKPAGTVAWAEHVEAWEAYAKRYGKSQSAERMAERHGFSYGELLMFLGREPETWRPR